MATEALSLSGDAHNTVSARVFDPLELLPSIGDEEFDNVGVDNFH
jgi:hypothetical protein